MDLIITILSVVTKDLPISPRFTPYDFYRDASSALLLLVNQWLDFYLLTFPRFPLRKKEHKSYFGKNRTRDFRTSRCAGYLLDDHSGDEGLRHRISNQPLRRKRDRPLYVRRKRFTYLSPAKAYPGRNPAVPIASSVVIS